MIIDDTLLDSLTAAAAAFPRLRMNYDLRTSPADGSQRMLNALEPGTVVPVHRHPNSSETVICLRGELDEVLYEAVPGAESDTRSEAASGEPELREVARYHLCPSVGQYGCSVPAGAWHTVEVLKPSVIFEAKDGKYGEEGSENWKGDLV